MIHKRLVAPTAEPVSLAEAKLHLRVTDAAQDTLISSLISTARRQAEDATGRALAPQTWLAALDGFPCGGVRLPAPPLTAVSSVQYVDENGAMQTMASSAWLLDDLSEPAWLFPAYDTTWPSTRCQANAVRITVTCGYSAGTVPEPIKQWMLLHIGHWFENREASTTGRLTELPFAGSLLDPYRVITLD